MATPPDPSPLPERPPGREDRVGLFPLACEFAFIGATGFGGHIGLLIHTRIVRRRRWLDEHAFAAAAEVAAIAPGGTSTALIAEIGRRLRGPRGVAVAMAASLAPGTLFVIAMLSLYQDHIDDRWVRGLLEGAAAGGVATLVVFLIRIWQLFGRSWVDLAAGAVIAASSVVLPIPLVLVLAIASTYAGVTVRERRRDTPRDGPRRQGEP